jgi:hypothetical protein
VQCDGGYLPNLLFGPRRGAFRRSHYDQQCDGKHHLRVELQQHPARVSDELRPPISLAEEMTKAVLEAGSESAAQQTVAAVPSSALAVPASLHASLMARLDRLGPAKEVAQIGAAIGREFSHALLAAVTRKPEAELDASLNRLLAAGLLFRQGVPPYASYLLKHALVQDAAYGTLLREPRRAHCMPVLPGRSKASSATLPRTGRNCWRVTAPRLA